MKIDLAAIISNFRIQGTYLSGTPTGTGHINDSYLINTKEPEAPEYILQRINHTIFRDIDGLMENFERVTKHLSRKQVENKEGKQYLELIPANNGKYYYCDDTGNYWRVLNYIENGRVYDIVTDPKIAYEGGKAFGTFMRQIADIPVETIIETIPNFHNIEFRLENFRKSVQADIKGRLKNIQPEFEFIKSRAEEMLTIPKLQQKGLIPLRITHNDTKFNNIIFDAANEAICVVDLDTIMPGSALFDFGDAIRSGANTAAEDEQNLDLVSMDINIFESYAKGYLESTFDLLTETEKELLAFSARFITFVIGLRFLTDYLDGDTYYRTGYPEHNLVRARVQLKLVESMEKQFEKMQSCVRRISEDLKKIKNNS
jgi:hypothetical protein